MQNLRIFNTSLDLNSFSGSFLQDQVDPIMRLPPLGADPNTLTVGGDSGGSFTAD